MTMSTTRTSKADVNRLSVSNGIWGLDEGSDHAQNLPGQPDLTQINIYLCFSGAESQTYDAIFKVCDSTANLTIGSAAAPLAMAQGMENALDMNNRVSNVSIWALFGGMGAPVPTTGDQVITVKGGCKGITLGGTICSNGRNADVVVGNWSDQCHDQSTDLDFSGLVRADGKPVTLILSRCSNVKLPPGAKVLFWKSLGLKAYWWIKWCAVKLHIIG